MVCTAYFGELSEERKANWDNGDTDPYKVLKAPVTLERKAHDLLDVGSRYFHERITIDWGAFAWKCKPADLIRFLNDYKSTLPWLIHKDEKEIVEISTYIKEKGTTEFGIVFVEEF